MRYDWAVERERMSRYKVTGHALVPVEVVMMISAASASQAIATASNDFKCDPEKYIISGSGDMRSAYDFEPHAEEL